MPESYSVNQLKTWSKCRKKYEFDHVRKLQWPSNPKNFRLGKGVHQLLDYESRQLPMEPILMASDADIANTWRILHQSRWATLPIIASEWGFSLEISGNWLYGRIDRIVRDGDMIHILDWKTGTGIPLNPEMDWQTQVYLYAVFEAQRDLGLSIPAENLVFTYVQVKGMVLKEVPVAYDAMFHRQIAARLSETLGEIQSVKVYALPPVCPDRFCPYGKICGIQNQTNEPNSRPSLGRSGS